MTAPLEPKPDPQHESRIRVVDAIRLLLAALVDPSDAAAYIEQAQRQLGRALRWLKGGA